MRAVPAEPRRSVLVARCRPCRRRRVLPSWHALVGYCQYFRSCAPCRGLPLGACPGPSILLTIAISVPMPPAGHYLDCLPSRAPRWLSPMATRRIVFWPRPPADTYCLRRATLGTFAFDSSRSTDRETPPSVYRCARPVPRIPPMVQCDLNHRVFRMKFASSGAAQKGARPNRAVEGFDTATTVTSRSPRPLLRNGILLEGVRPITDVHLSCRPRALAPGMRHP